jgi:hypothetical protein
MGMVVRKREMGWGEEDLMGLLGVVLLWLGSSEGVFYCMAGGYKSGKGMDQKGVLEFHLLVAFSRV